MDDVFAQSAEQWKQAYDEGAHASFKMVEVLMDLARVTYSDFLRNPALIANFQEADEWPITDVRNAPYNDTWESMSGRCTSFTIKVAYNLKRMYPDELDFLYYDLGSHRIARCERAGVLIDSESERGVVIIPENTAVDRRGALGITRHSLFSKRIELRVGEGSAQLPRR